MLTLLPVSIMICSALTRPILALHHIISTVMYTCGFRHDRVIAQKIIIMIIIIIIIIITIINNNNNNYK